MLITFVWKVLQRSDACQNYPKSKGYLPSQIPQPTCFFKSGGDPVYIYLKQHLLCKKLKKAPQGTLNISLDFSLLKISLHSSCHCTAKFTLKHMHCNNCTEIIAQQQLHCNNSTITITLKMFVSSDWSRCSCDAPLLVQKAATNFFQHTFLFFY